MGLLECEDKAVTGEGCGTDVHVSWIWMDASSTLRYLHDRPISQLSWRVLMILARAGEDGCEEVSWDKTVPVGSDPVCLFMAFSNAGVGR